MGHRRSCRLYRSTVSISYKRVVRGGRCFGLRCREISDGGNYLPKCPLRIHRNHRRSLWTPFRPCSAPSIPILGLVAAVRGGRLHFDHGWYCGQQTTGGCKHCVKLAAVRSEPLIRSAIIFQCAAATDYPGESRSLRNTLIASPAKKTGVHGTTSPPHSLSPSFASIRRTPFVCSR